MPKIKISLSPEKEESVSTANPYLSADGLLDFSKIATLQGRVEKLIKEASKPARGEGGVAQPIKPTAIYVMKRRAKPVQFRASLHEKGDLKYRAGRAIKVAMRKRLAPESLARVAVVLQVIDDAKLNPLLKQAVSALTQHMKRTEKHVAKISTEEAKIRDAANSVFDTSAAMLKTVLLTGGLKDSAILEAQGMMGKTVLIKLGTDNYVSVTKADKARWSAAVKASKAQE